MSDRRNVIYCYDGTFDGLMCCVFDSYTNREVPSDISVGEPVQLSFDEIKYIETDLSHAERIINSIPRKMSDNALDFLKKAFLTCAPDKEMLILKFMYMGYKYGPRVMNMLAENTIYALNKAVHHCCREAGLIREFIRFSDNGDTLSAVIEPKNKVIPMIAEHFIDRYRNEKFLIYDKTNRMALIYSYHQAEIVENIDFELPEATKNEEYYRQLWKTFYKTIGIEERYNPKCRMTLMPKRYWNNMIEMQDEINKPQNAARPSGLDSISRVPTPLEQNSKFDLSLDKYSL